MRSDEETKSLITSEPASSDYGGLSFKSAVSSFPSVSSSEGANSPHGNVTHSEPSGMHRLFTSAALNETYNPPMSPSTSPVTLSPTVNNQNSNASTSSTIRDNGASQSDASTVQIVSSLPEREPRTRTTSERFHCHVGGGEESDDEELVAIGAAGERGRRGGGRVSAATRKAMRALWLSVAICLVFMICEVAGGVWAQSLAIITDAAHLLTDLASMLISLFSLYLASRPASQRMSFGWYRAEVVGAFISVFMIWVVTGILVYLAIERMITAQYDIDAEVMAITAGLGVLVNIIMGAFLYLGGHSHSHLGIGKHSHSHSHSGHGHENGGQSSATSSVSSVAQAPNQNSLNDPNFSALLSWGDTEQPPVEVSPTVKPGKSSTNINLRAAFIHVLGDLIQSVGVLMAALLILWKESLAVMDPICTLIFSVIVVSTTVYIIRDALVVLLEGRPSSIDFRHVFEALEQVEGVRKVHDLRIWALTIDKVAISVHLEISSNAHAQTILKNTTLMLRRDFNVYESTVQIEGWRPDSANCFQCIAPAR